MAKHGVVGTAGHSDHGKTSLVKALTGIDTDRLPEEKARGITIDLGFAFLEDPPGPVIEIVDVPGHERFVKNMLAGVGGIDLAMLVVAADEGVMPQTREHLAICSLLHIKRGLVVLTKTDLVERDWLELVKDDVTALVRGTFLEGAPRLAVSAKTGEGLSELRAALRTLAETVAARGLDQLPRLPIDRVFPAPGQITHPGALPRRDERDHGARPPPGHGRARAGPDGRRALPSGGAARRAPRRPVRRALVLADRDDRGWNDPRRGSAALQAQGARARGAPRALADRESGGDRRGARAPRRRLGRAARDRDKVRRASHQVRLTPEQQRVVDRIEQEFLQAAASPPSPEEALGRAGVSGGDEHELFQFLVEGRKLVRVKESLYFHAAALDTIQNKVVALLRERKEIGPGDIKDLLGISRKYAIPLLEHLDARRVTVRTGEKRVLRGA